ncbi:hypothetical protein [Staphylococcus capitis]|uniref:hypothetical protein n=1 Tax=Staphylococcus capitis TaxID=29388 RepID=UPI00145BB2E8|nr:hypothetical protein [Staphylococcus capitis]NMK90625.1 hypothetical protein [Staphylococcus capitis]
MVEMLRNFSFKDFQRIYKNIVTAFSIRNGEISEQDKKYIYQLMNIDYNYCSVSMECILMNAKYAAHYRNFITCLEGLCCFDFDFLNFEDYDAEDCEHAMTRNNILNNSI